MTHINHYECENHRGRGKCCWCYPDDRCSRWIVDEPIDVSKEDSQAEPSNATEAQNGAVPKELIDNE